MFQMIFSFCSSSDGNCLPEVYWGVINFIFFSNFKLFTLYWGQFSSVAQSCPTLCDPMNPWIAAHQASLSITNSQSSPKPMSIESVMLSNHLILGRPLLLLPSNSCSVISNSLRPRDCSKPGFPVHHQLLVLAQTQVHRISDAMQPSHHLSFPSPPAFNLIGVFSNKSVLGIRWPKYWSFSFSISPSNEYSGADFLRKDCFHHSFRDGGHSWMNEFHILISSIWEYVFFNWGKNSHNIKLTTLKCTIQCHLVHSWSHVTTTSSFKASSLSQDETPYPLNSHSFLLVPRPWQPLLYFLSLWLYLFWIPHKNRITKYLWPFMSFPLASCFLRSIHVEPGIGTSFLYMA